ncbi:MAG TPA: hypothetical protein VH395_02375 [Jatrophihabitantaceae bacterium]|jgi:hypothetical protein
MRRAAIMITALLVLAGCSSSGSGQGTTAGPTSGQSAASPSTSSPSSPSTPNTPSQSAPTRSASAAHRNVKAQLLTVDDLPAGWAADNSSDSDDSGPEPPCLKTMKAAEKATEDAEADFVQGTDFPILQEQLGYFGSQATALRDYAVAVATLNRCRDFSFTSEGHKFTGTIGRLSFPKLGQRSAAWRLRLTAEGLTFGIDLLIVQKGPELNLMLYGSPGTPDTAAFAAIAGKAVAKMPAS